MNLPSMERRLNPEGLPPDDQFWGYVLLGTAALATWLLAFRPRVRLTSDRWVEVSRRSAGEVKGVVRSGPYAAMIGPMVRLELERVEALEVLAMALAHLSDAEARVDLSPRVPLLMAIRDKLARALREES